MEHIASLAAVVTIVGPVLAVVRTRVTRATPRPTYTPLVRSRD